MKALVAIKRVIDPYVKIRVRPDGCGVETQNTKMAINPFDEIALEEAVRWKEQNIITEIIVVSIGPEVTTETLRAGLAFGADRAILIKTDQDLEPLNIAKILTHIIQQEKPNIVIMGKQAIDNDSNQTGQMVAGMLNWPQACFASKIIFNPEKTALTITREIDGGLETVCVNTPCVITTDLRLNEPRYLSLPNIMKAKSKPIHIIDLMDISETLNIKPRTKTLKTTEPHARKPGIKVKDVSELIHHLRNTEKII